MMSKSHNRRDPRYVVDDREVRHPIRPMSDAEARRVSGMLPATLRAPLGASSMFYGAAAVFITVMVVPSLLTADSVADALPSLFGVVTFIGLAWWSRRWIPAKLGRRYKRMMLRIGRCPTCHYEMRGLMEDADGCVTCPECAAAWRLLMVPDTNRT